MAHYSAYSAAPPMSKSRAAQQSLPRSSGCTHAQMTRMFDHHGYMRCSLCNKVPPLGWLYCCTQESNGNLSDVNFFDMEQAFARQHIDSRPTTSSQDSSVSVSGSLTSSFPTSSTVATTRVDEDNGNPAVTNVATVPDGFEPDDDDVPTAQPDDMACNFQVCQTCRPIYRDRAWQSLDSMVTEPVNLPSQQELHNRRISDAAILAQMTYKGSRYYRSIATELLEDRHSPRVDEHDQGESMMQESDEDVMAPPNRLVLTNLSPMDELEHANGNSNDGGNTAREIHHHDDSHVVTRRSPRTMTQGAEEISDQGIESLRKYWLQVHQDRLEREEEQKQEGTKDTGAEGEEFPEFMGGSRLERMRLSRQTPPAVRRNTYEDLTEEDREKRMGRRLSTGRFFID